MDTEKTALIIGAGPAGLTAAYELLTRSKIKPVIFEEDVMAGGISRTVNYKGNRIDIGGHRFFSKSDRVTDWWLNLMPRQSAPAKDDVILDRHLYDSAENPSGDPARTDRVLLVRPRVSRILYSRRFFDYPVSLSLATMKNLGPARLLKIGFSYLYAAAFPRKQEKSLEDFFVNRFGHELYATFFRDYTQKVWGVPCSEIKPEWGAQRVKGLSVAGAIKHAVLKMFSREDDQKKVETSLIDKFMYPKFGPGQLWETAASEVKRLGGEIHMRHKVVGLKQSGGRITSVTVKNLDTGEIFERRADYIFSTMPVRDLVSAMDNAPSAVREVAEGLVYRDFVTAGLLLKKLKVKNRTAIKTVNGLVPDTWIYVQEPDVKMGRIQVFNNWSPYLVAEDKNVWLGLEFFCQEGDSFWSRADKDIAELAAGELARIGFADRADVLDYTVVRSKKTYPAYFGTYDRFAEVRAFTDSIENLYLIGRNGMHRYNNMDHSMLSAMTAVDNILAGRAGRDNIWRVNTEEDYHEEKAS